MPLSNYLLLSSINIIYFMCINFVRINLKNIFLLVTNSIICKNKEKSLQHYHVVSKIFNGLYKNKNFCSNDYIKSKLRISKWCLSDNFAGLTSFTKVSSIHLFAISHNGKCKKYGFWAWLLNFIKTSLSPSLSVKLIWQKHQFFIINDDF